MEKLSPRFHPNVTDLTSRGNIARFPRIIILLFYNSFNSRESKMREENNARISLYRVHARSFGERLRYALNERRHDAVTHGSVEIGTFYRCDSTMISHDRNSRESSVTYVARDTVSSSEICVSIQHCTSTPVVGSSILYLNSLYSRRKIMPKQIGR